MHLPSIKIKPSHNLQAQDRLSSLRVPTLQAILRSDRKSSESPLKLKTQGNQSYKAKKLLSTIEPTSITRRNPTNYCQINLNKYSVQKQSIKSQLKPYHNTQIFLQKPGMHQVNIWRQPVFLPKDDKKSMRNQLNGDPRRIKRKNLSYIQEKGRGRSNDNIILNRSVNSQKIVSEQQQRQSPAKKKCKKYDEMSISEIIGKDWDLGRVFRGVNRRQTKVLIYKPYQGW